VHVGVSSDLQPVRRVSWWRAGSAAVAVSVVLTWFEIWTYSDCLGSFFHFDDFWVLAAAAHIPPHSLSQLWRVFEPIHGFLLYRPLSTVLYFFTLREAFGYDPVGYHAVQIAFQALNGLLVYAIADSILFSRPLAAAAALIYVTAPGHALAACWVALFTMTGTTFLYFFAVWVWVRLDSRWRFPLTFLLFCLALLASEHAVSLPLTLTATSLLLTQRSGMGSQTTPAAGPGHRKEAARGGAARRTWRELAAFYLVGGSYVVAKLYYMRYGLAGAFPDPAARAYVEAGYHVSFEPVSILRHLGRYCTFTIDLLYDRAQSDTAALFLGVCVVLVAAGATVAVAMDWRKARPLRVAAFGLDVFIIGLAPVLVLPEHFYSYYVGIAAMGMALAIVGVTAALPRVSRLAPWVAVALIMAVHMGSTAMSVRASTEFRFLRSFSESAARWLYTLRQHADDAGVAEVVVPESGLTDLVFNTGKAHQLFLCADYQVVTAKDMRTVEPTKGRLILVQPDPLPSALKGSRPWLHPCPDPG